MSALYEKCTHLVHLLQHSLITVYTFITRFTTKDQLLCQLKVFANFRQTNFNEIFFPKHPKNNS